MFDLYKKSLEIVKSNDSGLLKLEIFDTMTEDEFVIYVENLVHAISAKYEDIWRERPELFTITRKNKKIANLPDLDIETKIKKKYKHKERAIIIENLLTLGDNEYNFSLCWNAIYSGIKSINNQERLVGCLFDVSLYSEINYGAIYNQESGYNALSKSVIVFDENNKSIFAQLVGKQKTKVDEKLKENLKKTLTDWKSRFPNERYIALLYDKLVSQSDVQIYFDLLRFTLNSAKRQYIINDQTGAYVTKHGKEVYFITGLNEYELPYYHKGENNGIGYNLLHEGMHLLEAESHQIKNSEDFQSGLYTIKYNYIGNLSMMEQYIDAYQTSIEILKHMNDDANYKDEATKELIANESKKYLDEYDKLKKENTIFLENIKKEFENIGYIEGYDKYVPNSDMIDGDLFSLMIDDLVEAKKFYDRLLGAELGSVDYKEEFLGMTASKYYESLILDGKTEFSQKTLEQYTYEDFLKGFPSNGTLTERIIWTSYNDIISLYFPKDSFYKQYKTYAIRMFFSQAVKNSILERLNFYNIGTS